MLLRAKQVVVSIKIGGVHGVQQRQQGHEVRTSSRLHVQTPARDGRQAVLHIMRDIMMRDGQHDQSPVQEENIRH
jgi:hypothetical protein